MLIDLYRVGIQLQLLPATEYGAAVIASTVRSMNHEQTAQEGLVSIANFMAGLIFQVAKNHRNHVASLYDLAKHLQAFHKLLANADISRATRDVLATEALLMHKDSVGMRIDLPNEEVQLTKLHQEFHSFPFGINAAVMWVPLTRISRFNGTLSFYPRPHPSDPIPFYGDVSEQDRLLDKGRPQEAQKAGKLQISSAELGPVNWLEAEPGQCYLLSAVLPHASVPANPSAEVARLTCQARLFDVNDAFLAWKHRGGNLWNGLKRPSEGWQLWKDYNDA